MDALLRELREGPDGIPEYHDSEISADALGIGSAADQQIQLLGRAIAPEHAVIRKFGDRLDARMPPRPARARQRQGRQFGRSSRSAMSSRSAATA